MVETRKKKKRNRGKEKMKKHFFLMVLTNESFVKTLTIRGMVTLAFNCRTKLRWKETVGRKIGRQKQRRGSGGRKTERKKGRK